MVPRGPAAARRVGTATVPLGGPGLGGAATRTGQATQTITEKGNETPHLPEADPPEEEGMMGLVMKSPLAYRGVPSLRHT